MGSGGKKGRGEGGGGGEETYVPSHPTHPPPPPPPPHDTDGPSLPTLRPPFNIFFPAQIFFALPPLSDRLEQATKDVFQSSR